MRGFTIDIGALQQRPDDGRISNETLDSPPERHCLRATFTRSGHFEGQASLLISSRVEMHRARHRRLD